MNSNTASRGRLQRSTSKPNSVQWRGVPPETAALQFIARPDALFSPFPVAPTQTRSIFGNPFKMAKKQKKAQTIVVRPDEAERQAEAAKTTRLRALRLAKEAADRDAARREVAVKAEQHRLNRASRSPAVS
jgi:hypothetical protein